MRVEAVDLEGGAVAHAQRPQTREAVRPLDRRRHERNAGLERDPCRPGMCSRLVLLDEPFPLARAMREHHHDVTFAHELDGGVDRLHVALAAADLECPAGADEGADRPPEQLGLGHEAEVAARPERDPERPRIEVGDVVRGEHEPAVLRQVLHACGT